MNDAENAPTLDDAARAAAKTYAALVAPRPQVKPSVLTRATLRERREAAGLSVEAAAEMIGLEPHQLAGVEKGWRDLTHAQARRAAQMLTKAADGR